MPMKRIAAAFVACLAPAALAAAQSAAPVREFRISGTPDAAITKLHAVAARCWHDDYDSRVHGFYREVAHFPPSGGRGGTVRLEWQRVENDRTVGLLKRVIDIVLSADGAGTRVTVLAYGPYARIGEDVEAWLNGRQRCFAGRYPSP